MNEIFSRHRLRVCGVIVVLFVLYVVICYGRLAFSPVSPAAAPAQELVRGSIVDRNGKPLAVQTNFYHLSVTPSAVSDAEKTAEVLSPVLNLPADYIQDAVQSATKVFYLKKRMDENEYEAVKKVIQERKLSGLRFDRIPGRAYPENALASQLIGFMGDDGEGLAGVEYSMQNVLSPREEAGSGTLAPGRNVYLTIDANLQYKLEKIARRAMESTQAESVMMIAAEAETGEILSYISLPSVNLNEYRFASASERQDRPAVVAYEPGSVFKIFSVATFIDAGVISEDERFYCDGKYEVKSANGERVSITCLGHHGSVTAREALQFSCNDALAQMSDKINSEFFLAKLRQLGFGSKTGIELPGETAGLVKTTNDRLWSARSKPTISIGQEISVSALQMVEGATALANGGVPVKLTVVSRITDRGGAEEYVHVPQYGERIYKPGTAAYLLSCMQSTAKSGTGYRAALGDISIGVKTGTAQMADLENGGYSDTDFLSNCVAVFPVENPQIILYVVVTKAQGETYAGRIVAPVVAEAADVIIDHLGMSRAGAATLAHSGLVSIPAGKNAEIGSVMPDFSGVPKRFLTGLLNRTDLRVRIVGDGYVVRQNPPAGTAVTENMAIEFFLE
ncbi:penicillin-binding protein [Treponema brennaborense]|uniref:Peptidoglycan glycosyltransferase n=1 Tax=Treponema brennaborense (strain DSM 12168 / CIP 105900 / DD5/3) TaxID=906968 RepID=F4LJB0_TREBD|nr:penicillin-binding protein [Treponema brennaborense]AEE17355.1 Peptidoglycan glycosyltransferase [Treponema brennaborense DSM 12168]